MTSITIRDVPQETRDELAARAARGGRSLQQYLRAELIALAELPDQNELMARIQERKRRSDYTIGTDDILRHLDEGRREREDRLL
ncbi:MAG: hypothetical protein OXG55_00525 [bacterium]|nr:hypothetical protein [bacterium]MCY4101740.1 hypothetical protein [bacterium]